MILNMERVEEYVSTQNSINFFPCRKTKKKGSPLRWGDYKLNNLEIVKPKRNSRSLH